MKKLTLDLGSGKKIEVLAALKAGTLWMHVNGETFTYEAPRRSSRKGSGGASADPHKIGAPMPGKIIKIFAQKGEAVKQGQVLLVMEAMKMEYTLKAQTAGSVEDIRCAAGDQVQLGQVLIKLSE